MKAKRLSETKNTLKNHSKSILFVLVLTSISVISVFLIRAAAPNVVLESENATVTNPATTEMNDSTASGGDYVQFNGSTTSGFIGRNGTQLTLNGKEMRFVGFNAFQLTTLWSINYGCGTQQTDQQLDDFFKNLRPNSVVRTWGYQQFAHNNNTGQRDWRAIDRVLNAASKYNQKVVFALAGNSGGCDNGHWKNKAWYDGGYKQIQNDDGRGTHTVSFENWIREIVSRYKDNTTVAFWEPLNEPQPTECAPGYNGDACHGHLSCPNSATAAISFQEFWTSIGGLIKSIDPNHLISTGVIGNGQCGTRGDEYRVLHAISTIDIGSYHEYSDEVIPGDRFNGMQLRINQLNSLNKPLIVGEMGYDAAENLAGCPNLTARRDLIKAKFDGQFGIGVRGIWLWNYQQWRNGCEHAIQTGDPLIELVKTYSINQQ